MKHIIITGASGLVATELTVRLLEESDAELYLISTQVEELERRYQNSRVHCFTIDSFKQYAVCAKYQFDVCIHTAFARAGKGDQIAASLNYLKSIISISKEIRVKAFVNISSQSVYSAQEPPFWKEDSAVFPDSLYALGKYASETYVELGFDHTETKWTNIRLCSVCENARFVRIFVQNALDQKPIHLTAPNQNCSFIDVRDVADALFSLLQDVDNVSFLPVYNLGANLVCTIKDIAIIVKSVGESHYNLEPIKITEEDSLAQSNVGMDSSLFMKTFSWTPKYNMKDMVVSLFEMLMDINGRGIQGPLR